MKKRLQGIIIGILVGAMLTGTLAYAKDLSEKAQIYFRNIKIYIDGAEIVPKGSDGSIVEPFIMNGATYLPVRALSEALGQDVEWDGKTSSVYIGKKDKLKPDNYLDRIQYNDYKEADSYNDFAIINGTIEDYNGNKYTNGLLFYTRNQPYSGKIENDEHDSDCIIYYPLNSQYSNLKGKIVLPSEYSIYSWEYNDDCSSYPTNVYFYGDGELLYSAKHVTASMPFSFDVDVSGVNQLYIKVKSEMSYPSVSYVALTDLALYE